MPSKLSKSFRGLGCFTPLLGISLLIYFFYQHSFLLGCIAGVVSFSAGIILYTLVGQTENRHKQQQIKILQTFQPNRADFQKLKSFTSYDLLTKIAIDQQQQTIYFWVPDSNKDKKITKAFVGMPYDIKTYHFSDLLAIKFIENGHQMASVQKDTHYTIFLLNKIQKKEMTINHSAHPPIDNISSMDLEIIVNDNEMPRHRLCFYHEPYRKMRKDSPEYEAFHKEFQKWFNRLKVMIYETEQNVMEQNFEKTFVSIDSPITEEAVSNPTPMKRTQITVDIDTRQPSLHFSKEAPARSEEILDSTEDDSKQGQTIEKPKSYFEQLVEKNKRQLRGDYTDK